MNALIIGYYGFRNLGDEMMLFYLRGWLAQQDIALTVLSEIPEAVTRLHGVPAVLNLPLLLEWNWVEAWLQFRAWRSIRAVASADVVIAGGGDCFPSQTGNRAFIFSLEKYALAILLGKPVYWLNVGLPRLLSGWKKFVFGAILRRCKLVVVRDEESALTCESLTVRNVRYAPDVVLSMASMARRHSPIKGHYIMVCLCKAGCDSYRINAERQTELARSLDHLAKMGFKVIFVPFQDHKELSDNIAHLEVANRMQERDSFEVRPWSSDFESVTSQMAGASLVVAMRLHAAILAVACKRPCVVMPYHQKVVEFCRQAGLTRQLSAESLDLPGSAARFFEDALTRPDPGVPLPPPDRWEELFLPTYYTKVSISN